MIKKLLFMAVLLVPELTYGGNPSADLSVQVVPAGTAGTFVINFNDGHQTIDGFGAGDMWVGLPSFVRDMTYCVNATDPGCSAPGIGLSILRQDTGDPNGVDQADGLAVTARGGKVIGTPTQFVNGVGQATWTITNAGQAQLTWASNMRAAGVNVYALTVQNEPDCFCNGGNYFDVAPYIDYLAPLMHSQFPGMKFIAPDVYTTADYGSYTSTIEHDSTANAQTDIFDYHGYGPNNTPLAPIDGHGAAPNDHSRPVWVTEAGNGCCYDPSIQDAVNSTASAIHHSLVDFDVNNWMEWWIVYKPNGNNAGDNLQVLNADSNGLYGVPKRYFAIGNWSRYVRPGWVRIGVSGSLSGLSGVSAFKNPSTGAFAIIAINNSGSDIPNVTFGLTGGAVTGSVTPYVTSGTPVGPLGSDGNLSAGSQASGVPASLPVTNGMFTSTVPYGVTTFVGPN